jgi:hypothetical protein
MKTIYDTPKELHELFEKELAKWPMPPDIQTAHAFRLAVQHFFFLGFDVAMATGGMKPNRKIVQLIKTDQGLFSLADTGEWFYLVRPLDSECHWVKYPDLPQD